MAQEGLVILLSADVPIAPELFEQSMFVFRPSTTFAEWKADGQLLRETVSSIRPGLERVV
jgi:hypothetical protein